MTTATVATNKTGVLYQHSVTTRLALVALALVLVVGLMSTALIMGIQQLRPQQQVMSAGLVIALVCFSTAMMGLLLWGYVDRYITQPLRRLTCYAHALRVRRPQGVEQQTLQRRPAARRDELDELGVALHSLHDRLTNLESRVDKRITETHHRVSAVEARFRVLASNVTDYAVCMMDRSGAINAWNAGAVRMFGFSEKDMLSEHFSTLYMPDDAATELPSRTLELVDTNGRLERTEWLMRKDGSHFVADLVVESICNEAKELLGYGLIIRDRSEQLRQQSSLFILREYVPLRTVLTHGEFRQQAENAFARARQFDYFLGLVLVEIDHLSELRNSYGALVAKDEVLVAVYHSREQCHDADVLGMAAEGQLAILVPGVPESEVRTLGDHLSTQIRSSGVVYPGGVLPCSASVGVATLTADMQTLEALWSAADAALHAARDLGCGQLQDSTSLPDFPPAAHQRQQLKLAQQSAAA